MFIVMLVIQNQRFKSSFLQGSIATNGGPIEGKWLETIVHMAKFGFLSLACPKQVQFLVLTHVRDKFQLSPTSTTIYTRNKKKFQC